MRLGDLQREFTITIAELVIWAYEQGYELTYSHALRCQDCPVGHKNSNHKRRLAVDFNLFTAEGDYLTKTEDYAPLGRYWKSLNINARWGGDFSNPDGVHFSFEYQGQK